MKCTVYIIICIADLGVSKDEGMNGCAVLGNNRAKRLGDNGTMEEYKLGHRDRVLYHGNVELSKNKKLQMCKRLWSQGFVFFHLL